MKASDIVNRLIEEISENYIIPTSIEPKLRAALTIREEIEGFYNESEKQEIPYRKIKQTIDSHIAGIITKCFPKK